jgi:hypothetical protein
MQWEKSSSWQIAQYPLLRFGPESPSEMCHL